MFFVFKSLKIKHGNGMCCKVMGILSQKMIMLCFYITHTHVNLQDKIIEIEAQLFFSFEDMFNLVIWVWPFHNSWDIVSRLVYFMYICRRVFYRWISRYCHEIKFLNQKQLKYAMKENDTRCEMNSFFWNRYLFHQTI